MRHPDLEMVLEVLETDANRVLLRQATRGLPHEDKDTFYAYLLGCEAVKRRRLLGMYKRMSREDRIFHTQEIIGEIVTDELTGLFNRRKFWGDIKSAIDEIRSQEKMEQALARPFERRHVTAPFGGTERRERNNHSNDVSLLIMDIDNFKRINDEYGHDVGDRGLQIVSHFIKSTLRQNDNLRVYRVGGEEFAALIRYTSAKQGVEVAHRIRTAIATQLVSVLPDRGITLSVGVSNYKETCKSRDPVELYKQADMALYAAKDAGRNCAKVYNPNMEATYRDKMEKKYK